VSDLREILRALDDKITEDELDEMVGLWENSIFEKRDFQIAEIDTDGKKI